MREGSKAHKKKKPLQNAPHFGFFARNVFYKRKMGSTSGAKLPSLASAKTLEEGAEKQVTRSANVISKEVDINPSARSHKPKLDVVSKSITEKKGLRKNPLYLE